MKKVLIVFDSVSGATEAVAGILAKELAGRGWDVKRKRAGEVKGSDIASADAVAAGSPSWFGRPSLGMRRFLRENAEALAEKQLAFFFTCLTLPREEGLPAPALPVFTDPALSGVSRSPARLNLVEFAHTPFYAARRLKKRYPRLSFSSVAFLGGRLDFSRMKAWQKIAVFIDMIFLEDIREGDFLNQKAVKSWAAGLFS